MESLLRTALIEWLRADPALQNINAIEEESPLRATPPWLGIAASASTDWGVKERAGREVRIALELESRAEDPAADAETVETIEHRISLFARDQVGFELASSRFLRARSQRRPNNLRGVLIEYRFRILEPTTE